MKHTEVERKFAVRDLGGMRMLVAGLGAQLTGRSRQVDTYFNAPHKDFLEGDIVSEWLRLRDDHDIAGAITTSVNFKRWLPLGAAEQTHCDEYESQVADRDALRRLFEALEFTVMVTVDKTRERWQLGDVEIAIDTVEGLGSFAEFEYTGDADVLEEAAAALNTVIDRARPQLGERDRRGYPYLLLGRQR